MILWTVSFEEMIKSKFWTLKWEFTLAFLWQPFNFCILIGALNTWKHWRNWSEYHLRLIKPKWAQNNATYLFLRIVKRWIPFPSTPPSVFCLRASLLFSPKDCRLLWKPSQFFFINVKSSQKSTPVHFQSWLRRPWRWSCAPSSSAPRYPSGRASEGSGTPEEQLRTTGWFCLLFCPKND